MTNTNVETLEWLKKHSEPKITEIEGIQYCDRDLSPIFEPMANSLFVHTLTGFVDYVKENLDSLPETMVHVFKHDEVHLFAALESQSRRREYFIRAKRNPVDFEFGCFMDAENFNVRLQSLFIESKAREQVLKITGNVKEESVRQSEDDGVTQKVTARSGVALVAEVELPNPVGLRPYRTFLEVPQPLSNFVLRAKDGPRFALFEADGGAWKLDAIKKVRDYLAKALPGKVIIA